MAGLSAVPKHELHIVLAWESGTPGLLNLLLSVEHEGALMCLSSFPASLTEEEYIYMDTL